MLYNLLVFLGTVLASTESLFILITLLSIHIAYIRSLWMGLILLITTLTMGGVVTYLKHSFAVVRPDNPLIPITGYAFPSGHAAGIVFFSFVVYTYLFHILEIDSVRKPFVVALLITVSIFICYTRVYFNVHTPLQVLAGASLGLFFGIIVFYILTKVNFS